MISDPIAVLSVLTAVVIVTAIWMAACLAVPLTDAAALVTIAVASQANVGGAASAMAMASARGYTDRLLPGIIAGLLGYAVGNYTGYAIAILMRGLLGG